MLLTEKTQPVGQVKRPKTSCTCCLTSPPEFHRFFSFCWVYRSMTSIAFLPHKSTAPQGKELPPEGGSHLPTSVGDVDDMSYAAVQGNSRLALNDACPPMTAFVMRKVSRCTFFMRTEPWPPCSAETPASAGVELSEGEGRSAIRRTCLLSSNPLYLGTSYIDRHS